MSPEYRGEMGGRSAALVTYKDGKTGYWTGMLARISQGVLLLNEGVHIPLKSTEKHVIDEATQNHGFSIEDTWPPERKRASFYLGQLRSYLSFAKWRR